MKKVLVAEVFPASLLILCCAHGYANEINGSLSATGLVSDNARKQADNPIQERQYIYQAGLSTSYENWLIDVGADYQWSYRKYEDHTQADQNYGDGSSHLSIGKDDNPIALELNHSRHMLLATPDSVGLIENQQERDIFFARPELRKRIFNADRLSVGGQITRVKFPGNEFQNSKREGYDVAWLHPLSEVSTLQLFVQNQKIIFEHSPLSDYESNNALLSYNVALRKLKYALEFGHNESVPSIGERHSAPTYKLSASYQAGFHQISILANRLLTDTSFGNGNATSSAVVPGNDGLSVEIDKIDRTNIDLGWQTDFICTRCSFSVGLSIINDDYLEKDESSESVYAQANFSYAISPLASIVLTGSRSEVDFESGLVAQDYTLNYVTLEYLYQFVSGVNIRLALRNERRESDASSGGSHYGENAYSIGLGYNF